MKREVKFMTKKEIEKAISDLETFYHQANFDYQLYEARKKNGTHPLTPIEWMNKYYSALETLETLKNEL